MSFLRHAGFRLFLLSCLILFFELALIRWLSAYVLYLGYFTNFVLLGALLGIGAGALLANRPQPLIKALPAVLFGFFVLILVTRSQVSPYYANFVYFTSTPGALALPPYVLLPIIFVGVTTIFTLLSQDLGWLLNQFEPLRAYTLNIVGSLAGIALFTAMSFFSIPAWVWFAIAVLGILAFVPRDRMWGIQAMLLAGLVLVIGVSDVAFKNIWSPYYRLNLIDTGIPRPWKPLARFDGRASSSFSLLANGAGHQEFSTLTEAERFYQAPYTLFEPQLPYQNALVIGAGGGNDVAFALANGVQHVDAVEIDPLIVELGTRYHPEHPYSDPRVTVHIDDARAFLKRTRTTYDLVIFALPDSLVLASNASSIRLESYLFTLEAFEDVRDHLSPDGLFVLYNYYRYDWLVDKIGAMLERVFDQQAVYYRYPEEQYRLFEFATLMIGPRLQQVKLNAPGFEVGRAVDIVPATDNWPFLYMAQPSLPGFYTVTLLLMLTFAAVYIRRLAPRGALNAGGLPFFFMGAAFTLLETKSIVQFLLLFGATWLVNSLVFFAVLLVVLIANLLAARYRIRQVNWLYGLLFVVLVLNILLPLRMLLFENVILRYTLAILLLFSPIFIANLIYSALFREVKQASSAFGANLLGTMLGGASEYLALYFGYHWLVVLAAIFYVVAFVLLLRLTKPNAV